MLHYKDKSAAYMVRKAVRNKIAIFNKWRECLIVSGFTPVLETQSELQFVFSVDICRWEYRSGFLLPRFGRESNHFPV